MTQITPEQLNQRFGIAQDKPAASASQLTAQANIRDLIFFAARAINEQTPDGREKAVALTHLEDALMWAGKAVFSGPTPERAPDHTAPLDLLALPIEQFDVDSEEAPTVGAYLALLLNTLLVEEEGFDGKRPLGNSGWLGYVEEAIGGEDKLPQLYLDIAGALS